MSEYIIGETVRINNTYTNIAGLTYDPSTIELRIFDPTGFLLTTVTYADSQIIRSDEGIYYYNYEIGGNVGYYVTKWTGVAGGFIDIAENQFYAAFADNKLYVSIKEVKESLMAGTGITMQDSTIQRQIKLAMSEVDTITGRSFLNGAETTEWFDTNTRNPYSAITQLYLTKLPAQTITTLESYNKGSLIKTYDSDEYYLNDNFIVELYEGYFPKGKKSVKVVYTHGYDAIPLKVTMLTSIITQIIIMREYMIGQDNAITGFSVPDIAQIQVGETYVSTERALAGLIKQKDTLIAEIGNLRNDVFVI